MPISRRALLSTGLSALFVGESLAREPLVVTEDLKLLMYERKGCAWCQRWDEEIAPIYPKTEIGQRVAFRRISLDRRKPDDPVLHDPVRFTPTFVLMRGDKEVGRITGYHNDAFFWGTLESMVEQLPKKHNNRT